jgi:hypothetical protein
MSKSVWSDAWLLLSLIYGREPLDRQRIRDIGDYINHAIFTDEEVRGGLRRLLEGKGGHSGFARKVEWPLSLPYCPPTVTHVSHWKISARSDDTFAKL